MRRLLLALALLAPSCFAGYANVRAITIQGSKITGSLSNFPVLISGTYSYLATTANGGAVTNANGYDIVFSSDQAGTSLLSYERDSYTATSGAVIFWIKISSLANGTNTTIYMRYGNSAITTDQSAKTSVWDSNYVAVYHFSASASLGNDSTSNARTALKTGSPSSVTGFIGNGLSVATNNYLLTPTSLPITGNNLTLESWASLSSAGSYPSIMGQKNGSEFQIRFNSNNQKPELQWGYSGCGNYGSEGMVASTAVTLNTWHHIVGVIADNSAVSGTTYGVTETLYVDGVSIGTTTNSNCSPGSYITQLGLGAEENNGNFLTGSVDEQRISLAARSSSWIATEYANQSSPSTFYTVGALLPQGSAAALNNGMETDDD